LVGAAIGSLLSGCAPIGTYEVHIQDSTVPSEAVYEATDWLNAEVDCTLFAVVGYAAKWPWTMGRNPLKRGVITIEHDPRHVLRHSPTFVAVAHWNRRCTRGRAYLGNDSPDVVKSIAHELGHIACLEHREGTFMHRQVLVDWRHMDSEQRAHLRRKCGEG
jgi:hypothetical protein